MLGDGRTTFQLQFEWDQCLDGAQPNCSGNCRTQTAKLEPEARVAPKSRRSESTSGHSKSHSGEFTQGLAPASEAGHESHSGQTKRSSTKRAAFTPEQDRLIVELKEGHGKLSWTEIHRQFSTIFPARSLNTLQVHYCTKLKRRGASDAARKADAQQIAVTSADTRQNEEGSSQQRVAMDSDSRSVSGSPMVPVDPALWNA
ncbi:hypothetical protein F5883DRAFT_594410 [Diaporthe sp. PMI_573]|nr:hypothetical protein F5883DRAFT_594410 [Diaporthaceae sp. PMI_573]